MAFGIDALRGSRAVVDHRLARRHLINEFHRGRLRQDQVCDAHPELLRAARNVGTRPGEQVHLIQSPKQTPGIENHFALVVDDLETCLADLAVHGVDVSNRMHVPGAGKQAFLKDPSGNVIELNQPD